MIYPITMYACKCDNCDEIWNNADGVMAYADSEHVRDTVAECEWHISEDGKTYCPDCHTIGDDDEVVIKPEKDNS